MPPGSTPDALTADGHGVTFLEREDGRLEAFWDGEGGEPFDALMAMRDETPTVFVSDDGEHLAFIGERDGRFFVARDGREDPPFEMFTRSVPPVFSHGGTHLAYGAGAMDDHRLVLDGRVANSLPIAPNQAVFSPSGDRLAFVEMRRAADGWAEQRIVLDGSPGEWFRGIRNAQGAMQFSPDGRRFAFYRGDQKGHAQWVVDGVAQRLTNEARSIGLGQIISEARLRSRKIGVIEAPLMACFSPDSRRFAHFADMLEKGVAILEDDVAGPLFKGVGMPVFSPDSRHLAYLAKTFSKKLHLVLDGEPGAEWMGSWGGTPVFSADSQHVAVTFGREEGRFLRKRHTVGCAVDGHILAEVDGDDASNEPVFSPDGDRVAWWFGRDGKNQTMVDGAPHTEEDVAISEPVFTCTGHLVYAVIGAPDGRVTITVDGRLGPLADHLLVPQSTIAVFEHPRTGRPDIPFAVSPDGEHVAWAGVFGEESRPIVDDMVGPSFDRVLDWSFDASGTAVWWVQRADTVYRVTAHTEDG
jgi:hypothetical protein